MDIKAPKIDLCKLFPKAREAKGHALFKLREFQKGIDEKRFLMFNSQLLSNVYPRIFPTPKDVDNFFTRVLGISIPQINNQSDKVLIDMAYDKALNDLMYEVRNSPLLEKDTLVITALNREILEIIPILLKCEEELR